MKKFKFNTTKIEGVFVIEPTVLGDDRGFFMKTYHEGEFKENGIDINIMEINHSKSSIGVLRGLHFQKTQPQGKLVRAIKGKVYDVAVDIRKDSKTFGEYVSVILSEKNRKQFYIPPGFAHGYLALSNDTEITYYCTDVYNGDDESGIIWNDNKIAIDWPINDIGEENLILSEKDKTWKTLEEIKDKL